MLMKNPNGDDYGVNNYAKLYQMCNILQSYFVHI